MKPATGAKISGAFFRSFSRGLYSGLGGLPSPSSSSVQFMDTMSVAPVPPEHLLYGEIVSVMAAMRKNSRWASHSRYASGTSGGLGNSMALRPGGERVGRQGGRESRERNLMFAFEDLKRVIRDAEDIYTVPLRTTLEPFINLILAPESTGPITLAALTAIQNILESPLVRPDSPGLSAALTSISTALCKCKFEPSDANADEGVLLKQLDIASELLCGPVGTFLGNPEACEILELVLTLCYQPKHSEILRRTAEYTMHRLIRKVFEKLESLDPEVEERDLAKEDSDLRVAVSADDITAEPSQPAAGSTEPSGETAPETNVRPTGSVNPAPLVGPQPPSSPSLPYSLITHQSLLVALISLLNPNPIPPSPPHRMLTTLSLFHTFILSSPAIPRFPSLMLPLKDTACRNLFILIRNDHPGVQTLALKVVAAILEIFGHACTGADQRALFLIHCLERLTPPPLPAHAQLAVPAVSRRPSASPSHDTRSSSPAPAVEGEIRPYRPPGWLAKGDTRDLLLEAITQLARNPSYMVDLFVNYDCDSSAEDMFEKLVSFLTAEVYPAGSGAQDVGQVSSQVLCLDILLAYVYHMCMRSEGVADEWPSTYPAADELLLEKSRKRLLKMGATLFAQKPKRGLEFFEQQGFVYNDPNESRPVALAKFLKNTPRLDKKVLGEFISKEENLDVLEAYMDLFNFDNRLMSDALRSVLETFRLPGESQPIGRITEAFSRKYRASSQTEDIRSDDAAYVLAYSVIMLNTDLHNPQNKKKRMTLEQYTNNLRGVNEKFDFSPEYLGSVYESIRKQEIIMPEEHVGQVSFDYAWKELIIRSKNRRSLMVANTPLFDPHLFNLTWKLVVSAIAYAFLKFDDEYLGQRIITGIDQCAALAHKFGVHDAFDHIVSLMAEATDLVETSDVPLAGNYPVVTVEEQEVTVSPLSIKLGRYFKGQQAVVVLFTVVTTHMDMLREEWGQVFEILRTFFLYSLLPRSLLQMEDFLSGSTVIPMKGSSLQASEEDQRVDAGLLSTLSSYLMTPYGSSVEAVTPQVTDDDIENTMSALDCIAACKLDTLYSSIVNLESAPLLAVLRGLQKVANRGTIDRLEAQTFTLEPVAQLPYDPGSVFILEMMISIVIKTSAHIRETWEIVFEHISVLLSNADRFSILLIERAVVGLLRLCQVLAEDPKLRDQLYLAFDLLGALSRAVQGAVGEQLVIGLDKIIRSHASVIRSQTEWTLVFGLLRPTVSHVEAAKLSFEIIKDLASAEDTVTIDNFPMVVLILQDFANAAGQAVSGKQQHIRRSSNVNGLPIDAAVPRGLRAVELLFDLKKFVPRLAEQPSLTPTAVWSTLWLPLLTALQNQSANTCRDVRHTALSHLQRLLLVPQVSSHVDNPTILFDAVVFPLLDELLKPQIYLRDPHGMSDTRLRASNLLCKTFLSYGIMMAEAQQDVTNLWIRILDYLDRFMNSGKRDQLYEAVPESLKNVVLVLHASDILVPPWQGQSAQQHFLWTSTQQRMDRFLPLFLEELIPTPPTAEVPDPKQASVAVEAQP